MTKKDKQTKKEEVKKTKSSGKGVKTADMSATAVVIDDTTLEKQLQEEIPEVSKVSRVPRVSRVRGKKYQEAKKTIDKSKTYPIKEALELLKKLSASKFDQTVEIHLNILEKGLSGDASLPHFKAKARKIAIFDESLAAEIKLGKINFDVLLATPADMPKILPLAKILGPKGLMPNPKNGTVIPDPEKAKEKFGTGAVHFKTEKDFPLIHNVIGKLNQPIEELEANLAVFIKAVNPKNITKAVVKSTMSPGIKISFNE